MPSKTQKGNYYTLKTRKWFERDGFDVVRCEMRQRIVTGDGRVFFKAFDIWGADLMASKDNELWAIQVKSNRNHIADGLKELEKAPWPTTVVRVVVYWEPRAREPEVHDSIEPLVNNRRDQTLTDAARRIGGLEEQGE
jgi:hypothetical protein